MISLKVNYHQSKNFIKEEETVELPSVEEFVEEEVEEDSITIEDANGDPFLEVTDVVKAPDGSFS